MLSRIITLYALIALNTSRRFTTGFVTVVRPDTTSAKPETHNASLSMIIDDTDDTISFHFDRYSDEIVWTGFAFEYLPYERLNFHNHTYAIILEYDTSGLPIVTEWTLGHAARGTPYKTREIRIHSDITHDTRRQVHLSRALEGRFTFPSNPSQLTVMAAFHWSSGVFESRHQGNVDDRNHTTVTFTTIELEEPTVAPITIAPTYVPTTHPIGDPTIDPTLTPTSCPHGHIVSATVNADDLIVTATIDCIRDVITMEIFYADYSIIESHWFGLVFNDIMFGDALVYTIGKRADRRLRLYSYDITSETAQGVTYTPHKDWSEISDVFDHGLRIIYEQDLSLTPWSVHTDRISFRYAIGRDLNLEHHSYRSEDVFTLYLGTRTPTTDPTPTIDPTPNPTANPSSAPNIMTTVSVSPTTAPTPQIIACPNGNVLYSSIVAGDLRVSVTLNCALNAMEIDIIYSEYDENWFGLVFNDKMDGTAVVYTNGKEAEELHIGLHSYDINGRNISNVVYNPHKQWTEISTRRFQNGTLRVVYSTTLHNTPWDKDRTRSVQFRYAIGSSLRLEKHIETSNVFVMDLVAVMTGAPSMDPTTEPTMEPTERRCVFGKSNTDDLMVSMRIGSIGCDDEFEYGTGSGWWVHLYILYEAYDDNWFGFVFNDEMSGYAAVYTTGKDGARDAALYSYNISDGYTIESVVYSAHHKWHSTAKQESINDGGLYIAYALRLENTPWNADTATIVFRYAIGDKNDGLQLTKHNVTSDVHYLHLKDEEDATTTTQSPIQYDRVVCNESNPCINDKIVCIASGEDASCVLECDDRFSCANIHYKCTSAALCHIECRGAHSCVGAEIYCAPNATCSVVAMQVRSLQDAVIHGAIGDELSVNCSGSINGCKDTTLYGYLCSQLTMDCRGMRGCSDMNIYCPPHAHETKKNCRVIGDGYGAAAVFHDALMIYAVNSWDDIDLSTYIAVNVQSDSQMFCGAAPPFMGGSCHITKRVNTLQWKCAEEDRHSECYRSIENVHRIECNEGRNGDCYNTVIDCNDISQFVDADPVACIIQCNAPYACSNSLIQCFEDKPCYIECNAIGACQYSSIVCANNNECNVIGAAIDSVMSAHIQSGRGQNSALTVQCVAAGSCNAAQVDAMNASFVSMECADASCRDIALQCPPYNTANGEAYCKMIGGGENEKHSNLSLYCVNGWNDINFNGYVAYLNDSNQNQMFCKHDYSAHCIIHSFQTDLLCQCPDITDTDTQQNNWVIIICVAIAALFVILIAIIIVFGAYEDKKKKYKKLDNQQTQTQTHSHTQATP